MPTITFHCRFITPAFLGGADPKGTPELRPPSIKGALRFWWRAMNGHLVEEKDGKPSYLTLLENEEQLFGGSTINQSRSPVTIRIRTQSPIYTEGFRVLNQNLNGLSYLLYTVKHHRLDDIAFDSGTKFSIEFSASEKHANELKKAIASFWLTVFFGSLGTRSRRGIGSLSVENIQDQSSILNNWLGFVPDNQTDMSQFLSSNYLAVKQLFSSENSKSNGYSQINLREPAYLSSEKFKNWPEALNSIGVHMQSLRTGKTHRDKRQRTFTMETLNKKAAFGLPVSVRQDNAVNFKDHDRRASPVYITLVFNESKKEYHWLVTRLSGTFMPFGEKIVFESKNPNAYNKHHEWPNEDNSLLDNFMNQIKKQSQKIG